MIGILLTGPNASGKTTALMKAMGPFAGHPNIRVIYGDSDKQFVDKPEVVQDNLRIIWNNPDTQVVVIEGTDRVARALGVVAGEFDRPLYCYVTVVPPAVMKQHLRERCEKAGKTFNEPYWTTTKCEYEGQKRYRNLVNRFKTKQVKYYPMDGQYTASDRLVLDIQEQVKSSL